MNGLMRLHPSHASISWIAACVLFGGLSFVQAESADLIVNGDFQTAPPAQGGVPDWTVKGDMTQALVVQEDGNGFLRLNLPQQGYMQVLQQFPVGKDWTGLSVSAKVRIQGLKKGPESYNTVTLLYTFEDEKGQHVGEWNQKMFQADQGWEPFEMTIEPIPEGAKTLTVACSIMNASGTADFDEVVVKPLTAAGK